MPVAHIGLTVEDLPASTTFFLSTLQPLGYRFFGTRNDQIGFGVTEADFFIGPVSEYVFKIDRHMYLVHMLMFAK